MKATETPYYISEPQSYCYIIHNGKAVNVAKIISLNTGDPKDTLANAKFVLQACNSYEEMLNACKGISTALDTDSRVGWRDFYRKRLAIDAAIALAEKE